MKVLHKTTDENGFIYEVILIIMKNNPPMNKAALQYKLLQMGLLVRAPLLSQALSEMYKLKLLIPPKNEAKEASTKEETKAAPTIIQPFSR
jgi:hypothetical protein